jgi:hypothetical protein
MIRTMTRSSILPLDFQDGIYIFRVPRFAMAFMAVALVGIFWRAAGPLDVGRIKSLFV